MFRNQYVGTVFDVAQICKNKHLINKHAESKPELNQKKCSLCGQETYTSCPICKAPIRGCCHTQYRKFSSGNCITGETNYSTQIHCQADYEIPAYCECGEPYPWTSAIIEEFNDIISMDDQLDEVDRAILKEKFPLILSEMPGTYSAALRMSKILTNCASQTVLSLKSAVASKIASQALELLGWK